MLAVLLVVLAAAPAASAARTETPLPQPDPAFPDVVRTLVTLDDPLPAGTGAPAACDELHYIRYRAVDGPAQRGAAAATVVSMPGGLAGGGSLQLQALKVVQDAADRGRPIEYWTIDRRNNCLEDRRGIAAARASGSAATALDYYFDDQPVDGRRFQGFLTSDQVPFLADFGVRRAIVDWRTLLLAELPDATYRRTRVFCGGHSFGATLAGLMMAWDFDGDTATRDDAGYQLCAGTFAEDSSADFQSPIPILSAMGTFDLLGSSGYAQVVRRLEAGELPRIFDLGFIGPEVLALLTGIGLNAEQRPDADTAALAARIPTDTAAETAIRFFASPTLADAIAPVAKLRRQHYSGEALLGLFLDDQTQQVPFTDTSLGSFAGGGVIPSQYPLPLWGYWLPWQEGPLYGWNAYDERQALYTRKGTEVTDVAQLARIMADDGEDFVEWYLPTRLLADLGLAALGSRDGDLAGIRYKDAARLRPRFTSTAVDGLGYPPSPPELGIPSTRVFLPGYNHLDAIFAALRQNTGAKERGAQAETSFFLANTGRTWRRVPQADAGARPAREVRRRAQALAAATP